MFRYISREVKVGNLIIGGEYPIRLQSMTNTNTLNTDATVAQVIRLIEAGCELVRITTPGLKEARNLAVIKKQLIKSGYQTPLVADIHFNSKAAELAASVVEKIRINPGNYISGYKTPEYRYNVKEYNEELRTIESNLKPLVAICQKHQTAIRIGVNQGSLGSRIVDKYGDTIEGMIVSAVEYARIFARLNFHNLVISVKSSNTFTMLNAYRELAKALQSENLNYPLHLGVTEAGEGLEGRLKSIAGIGAVLAHGIGDTIRVSLTEDPENELPVAKEIVKRFSKSIENNLSVRNTRKDLSLGITLSDILGRNKKDINHLQSDRLTFGGYPGKNDPAAVIILDGNEYLLASPEGAIKSLPASDFLVIDKVPYDDNLSEIIEELRENRVSGLILKLPAGISRQMIMRLREMGCTKPLILMSSILANSYDELIIENALHPGSLLLDGFGQGICLKLFNNDRKLTTKSGFAILQATRARITDTEYIACPSCGRTHFDIQQRLREVKEATAGFVGLKIAVMGCVVNGPGEMADSDFGYVGSGNGRVTLYKGRDVIKRSVPEEEALSELIKVIHEYPGVVEKKNGTSKPIVS